MQNLNISLWFNGQNPDSEVFVNHLQGDLKKCLNRFGLIGNIEQNPLNETDGFHVCVVFTIDESHADFISNVSDLARQRNAILVIADPINSKNFEIAKHSKTTPFWDKQYATGEIRLFRRDNPETKLFYWEKVTDIAIELGSHFNSMSKQSRGYVYLSQDEISHSTDRENILRDLHDLGFSVLPEKPLSSDFNECTNQIREALEPSGLIIHIIPPIYTPFFINQHLSLAEHQCNISAELIKNKPQTNRVIWIPAAYDISDEENLVFVEKIQRDQDQTQGSIVLKSSIEDLKKYYRHILSNDNDDPVHASESLDAYIIGDSNSNGLIDDVRGAMESHKLTADSNFSGITYNQHINKLALARVVVLCYTAENEQWFTVKVNDILKSRGVDTYRPFEKLILLKGNSNLKVEKHQNIFTNIVSDAKELKSLQFSIKQT